MVNTCREDMFNIVTHNYCNIFVIYAWLVVESLLFDFRAYAVYGVVFCAIFYGTAAIKPHDNYKRLRSMYAELVILNSMPADITLKEILQTLTD